EQPELRGEFGPRIIVRLALVTGNRLILAGGRIGRRLGLARSGTVRAADGSVTVGRTAAGGPAVGRRISSGSGDVGSSWAVGGRLAVGRLAADGGLALSGGELAA